MASLSAIILTMNESKNIENCIKSIDSIASRIIVVDSGSKDNTCELASKLGADIFYHEFENYAHQFNWALDNTSINTRWVLRIDADEVFTPKLCDEVKLALSKYSDDNEINGLVIRQRVYFMDKWIKYGGNYPFKKMMVFKHGIGEIENRKMDEHTILKFGKAIELKNDGRHYDYKDLTHWINKHNWYATREMQDYFELVKSKDKIANLRSNKIIRTRKLKKVYYKLPLFLRALLLFFYKYILKLGFLDGKRGLIFHFLQSFWYRFLVDAKIYEQTIKKTEFEKTGALKSR